MNLLRILYGLGMLFAFPVLLLVVAGIMDMFDSRRLRRLESESFRRHVRTHYGAGS